MSTGAYRGRGVSRLMCAYAVTDNQSFHVFALSVLSLPSLKKQAFDFLKRISYTNVSLKFLCDAKLIMPVLILYFLVKI